MKRVSRLFLFGTLIFTLLTAACGAEEGVTLTAFPGTEAVDLIGTPLDGAAATVETAMGTETATAGLETLETPTVGATDGAGAQATATGSPDANITRTPGIPVTGAEVVLVECQFCVDTRAQALLVLPDTATFEIVSPAPETTASTTAADNESRCSTVEVNNGRQVVLCSGPETTPLVVNICTDVNTCTDYPVNLIACPLTQAPNQSQSIPGADNSGTGAATTPSVVISTATP